jgi:hypothetical protein
MSKDFSQEDAMRTSSIRSIAATLAATLVLTSLPLVPAQAASAGRVPQAQSLKADGLTTDISARRRYYRGGGGNAAALGAFAAIVGTIGAVAIAREQRRDRERYGYGNYGYAPAYGYGGYGPRYYPY